MRCNTTRMARNGQPDVKVLCYVMLTLYSYWSECLTMCVDAAIESAGASQSPQPQMSHQQSPYHNSAATQHAHQFDGAPPRLPAVDDATHTSSRPSGQQHQQLSVHSSSSSGSSSSNSSPMSASSAGDELSESNAGIANNLVFEPSQLNFHELPMGSANTEMVTVFNRHPNRTVSIGPISGVLPDFYSHFFDDQIKVIEPLSNTSFSVVYLPQQLGPVSSELHVHSTFGTRRFELLGTATECPFRMQPLVGIRTALNATLKPEIVMYNPYAVPLQVLEVYSSGGHFKVWLPGGRSGTEAPRHIWEIAPHSERSVVQVSFRATVAGNYSAYLRIMVVDESSQVDDMELVLPMQFEVTDQLGLFSEQPFLHFGRAGRQDRPKRVIINLADSAAYNYRSMAPSIQSYAVEGDAALIEAITLRVHGGRIGQAKAAAASADEFNMGGFRVMPPAVPGDGALPATGDESEPETMDNRHSRVMSAELDWAKLTAYHIYRGHIAIRTLLNNNQEANLRIALVAVALEGSMFYNESHTQFVTAKMDTPLPNVRARDFVVRNDFTVPLVINNVSLGAAASQHFRTSDFGQQVLAAGQQATVFRIEPLPAAVRQPTVAHMRLHTNASTYEIRLASYDGLLRRIVPIDERTTGGIGTDELAISFGTLPLATVTDTTVAFVNDNPVPVTIHNWTATISEAASIFVILRGCSQLSMDGLKFCYSVQPGEWIVFQVSVMSNAVGTFVGRLTLRTDYEELQTPVRFNTAVGKLHISATETDERQCFPGGVCSLNLTAHSTFVLPITVREILVNVTGITYDYSHARQLPPVAPNRATHIARLHFHPRSICGDECYLQLPDRWAPSVISHNCKHQLPDLMHAKLEEFRRIRAAFATLAIRVQTNQVRRFDFNGSASILWPKLVTMPRSRTSTSHAGSGSSSGAATAASPAANSAAAFGGDGDADSGSGSDTDTTGARMDAPAVDVDGDIDNRGPIEFPTFQVGEEVLRIVEVTNPSDRPIAVHLMLHDMVRHGATMSLPPEVMSSCWDCFLSREQVFALVDTATVRPSELQVIAPRASVHVTVRFSTQNAGTYSNLLYVRNNFTILEAVWLTAKAAAHQFKFGNRKPGSDTPLVFELTEKHFRDCDRGHRAAAERKSSTALGELATAFADGISGISVGETVADDATDEQQRVRVVARRTFTAKNTGDIPIDIFGMYIEGIKCFAYGFKVMNCWNFRLPPDTTKKIEITFTPDFTLARVSRVLSIETSLNYPINYTLLSLVPAQALNTCGKAIERPTWEYGLQLVVFVALGLLLLLVMCQAFIDADRLLKEHAFNVSRDRGPTEPTLNLREVGLRNPIVEEAIGLAAAIDGSAADAPAGGAQKQLAAIASNGHGNGGGGGNGRSVRKRNAKRTESNDQLQQQLQPQQPAPSPSHQPPHKLLPVLEAKSWVNVLVRKASLFKTDVQFIEPTATPPPHNRSADNNKKDAPSVISGKRNVVAMMDANLPALAEAQNRTDDASSIGSTGSSTPSSNGSGKSSTGPTNKKSASYASPATATSNSNKRNLNMPLDMPSGGTQSNASSNQPTSTTTSTTSSSSSNPGQAAASNSNVASNVATPSISKTKSKALVKKTKSCPLQMPAQPTLPSVSVVTAASPASTATTSTNAKVGKHHTPTEPASTTQHNHVKLEGRAPACTSSADAAAVDTRKMDNNCQQNTKPSAFNQNHTIAESSTPNNIKSPVSNHNHTMSSTPAAAAVPPTQQSIKTPVSNHNHTIASPQAAAAKVPSAPNNAKSPATNHNVPAKPPAAVQSAQFNTKSSSANHNNTVPSTSAATSTKSSLPTIIKAADQNAVSTPSVAVASLPSVSLPDASSLSPADAFETEKSPTGAIKKYGKTPGRERRKDAPPPVTRKQNLNSALAGDHKPSTGALFFKSHAFQFNSLMGSATPPQQQPQQPQPQQTPTSFANFAPPVPTVKTSSAAPATSTVWDMNKATFSNVVAQSTISALPPMTQTATLISNVTLPRSTAPEKVSQINSANKASMATKPTEDAPNDATTSSLFSDPVPTITQSRNKISAPDGNNIESTALALDRAPLSSSTEGAKFRSSAERASGERQPFVDVDNQAAGYNHGPIGTRKSPVWEPLQESLLNSLYGLNATGNHLTDNSMGNNINGHNEADASMGNGHDIGPHNPNSFFSSNFPQYNRSAYDLISGGGVGGTDDHGQRVTTTSPIAAQQRQPPNLDLGGLSGLSDIFGSTRNLDFASNASAPSAIERSANLWDTPIGEIGVCNLKILFEQQQLQQQHHLQQQQQLLQQQQQQQLNQQQQNAMMSIATLSDLLSTNQFAGQAAALNNFNHHQSQQQLQQQLHYSTMQSHQPITSTIASTSGAALFADQSNLWSTQYNTAGGGQSGSQPTWGTALQYQQQQQQQLQLRQQHQQQQQQPHQLGAIRPPPGLEFQPFPHRLYNQQQMLQQLQQQQQQQQIQPQQQFNDNQHNLSGIGDLAVNTNVNNAMHNPVNSGSNNAFNAYNGLSSLWDPPVRPSTSNASLHSNHSAASPPPPPLPDLNRSM